VRATGTLYSLSKEGKGSTGALVAGLTVAVTQAAEEYAKRSPAGRLPVPLLAVLDEAANVCRWPELPNLYSHCGSRGICLLTMLQSWSQGVEVWGRDGMRKLWSAATIKLYGGGVSEVDFLADLSQLIGEFTQHTTSVSHAKGGRTNTHAHPARAHPRRRRPRRAAQGPRDRARRRRPAGARAHPALDDRAARHRGAAVAARA